MFSYKLLLEPSCTLFITFFYYVMPKSTVVIYTHENIQISFSPEEQWGQKQGEYQAPKQCLITLPAYSIPGHPIRRGSIKAGNQRARHFIYYIFMRSIPGPDQTIDQSLRGTSWFRDMFLSTGHRSWVLMRRWCCHLISLLAGGSVGHNHWIWQMDTMFIRSPQVPTFTLPANHSLHSPRRRYYLPTGMCSWRINWFLHRCRAFYRSPPHPFNVCCLLCVPFPRGASNNAIRVTHIGSVN